MGIPRTVINSSGSTTFGDVNAAIEWSRTRTNTRLYNARDSAFGATAANTSSSLMGSWNANLTLNVDYVSDETNGLTVSLNSLDYEGQQLPDTQVDVNVSLTMNFYYWDGIASQSLGTQSFNGLYPSKTIFAGATDGGTTYYTYDLFSNWPIFCNNPPCYGFVYSIDLVSPTYSGTAVNENPPFKFGEFRGKSRYRTYNGLIGCLIC